MPANEVTKKLKQDQQKNQKISYGNNCRIENCPLVKKTHIRTYVQIHNTLSHTKRVVFTTKK